MGVQSIVAGLLSDVIAVNRKLLKDVQYRVRKMEINEMIRNGNNTESRYVAREN